MTTPRKSWGPTIRRAIWTVQDEQCFYCAAKLETWTGKHMHLDHVDPLGRQGEDVLANLVGACIGCNLEKSAKTYPELIGIYQGTLPGAIVAEQIRHATAQQTTYQFAEPVNSRRALLKQLSHRQRAAYKTADALHFYDLPAVSKFIQTSSSKPMYSEQWTAGLRLGLCCVWERTGRPYYNVYPVVIDALSRTTLSVTAAQVLEPIRLPNHPATSTRNAV